MKHENKNRKSWETSQRITKITREDNKLNKYQKKNKVKQNRKEENIPSLQTR